MVERSEDGGAPGRRRYGEYTVRAVPTEVQIVIVNITGYWVGFRVCSAHRPFKQWMKHTLVGNSDGLQGFWIKHLKD